MLGIGHASILPPGNSLRMRVRPRKALAGYVAVARATSSRPAKRRRSRSLGDGVKSSEVREPAKQKGYKVPERGRLPREVTDAFDANR